MVNSGAAGMRTRGVIGTTAEPNVAPVKTLTHCEPVKMFAVEFGDEQGKEIRTVVFKVGDVIYVDPNGEQWARSLRVVAKTSWLYKQLTAAVAAKEEVTEVPKDDAVDVMGPG